MFARVAGYKLSQQAMTTVLKRYSRAMDDGRVLISFEDFVALSVRLRAYTGLPHKIQNAHRISVCVVLQDRNIHVILCFAEAFRARDRNTHGGHETGKTEFFYDDVSETYSVYMYSYLPCLQVLRVRVL